MLALLMIFWERKKISFLLFLLPVLMSVKKLVKWIVQKFERGGETDRQRDKERAGQKMCVRGGGKREKERRTKKERDKKEVGGKRVKEREGQKNERGGGGE